MLLITTVVSNIFCFVITVDVPENQRLVEYVLSPIVTQISFLRLRGAITWLNLRILNQLLWIYPVSFIVFIFILLQCFRDAINVALAYKNNSTDFMDEIMKELEVNLFKAYLMDF